MRAGIWIVVLLCAADIFVVIDVPEQFPCSLRNGSPKFIDLLRVCVNACVGMYRLIGEENAFKHPADNGNGSIRRRKQDAFAKFHTAFYIRYLGC